jgi:hypothetical protein
LERFGGEIGGFFFGLAVARCIHELIVLGRQWSPKDCASTDAGTRSLEKKSDQIFFLAKKD